VHHGEFRHPRLVEVYDADCPWGTEDDAFLAIVDEVPAARVLDLGCGTGRLAIGMAEHGHRVTGVDPAAASIDAARRKPGSEPITWIVGTSSSLPDATFDTVVMTSHVAQFFVGDDDWADVLADLHRALVPGGRLVFDSRDPAARAWERWNPIDSRHAVVLPDCTPVVVWTDVTSVADRNVSFTIHHTFPDIELRSDATLRFRSEPELRQTLETAGFSVERITGGWHGEPVGQGAGEFVVVARRSRS
jgi:ubiquinone/menaquinone biosynthesis C-methylase UbiE